MKLYEGIHVVTAHSEGDVTVLRPGPLGGPATVTMRLPMGHKEFKGAVDSWARHRVLIQDAFPALNADQREFLMTGHTPETWAALWAEGEEE